MGCRNVTMERIEGMQVTVYADMLFLVNWLMDYILLCAVAVMLRLKTEKKRLCGAAALGALWVCVTAIFSVPLWLEKTASLLLINSAMIRVAFKTTRKGDYVHAVFLLYAIGLLGGGVANLVYFHTGVGAYLKGMIHGETIGIASSVAVMISAGAVCGVLRMIRSITDHESRLRCCYQACLFLGDNAVTLTAFLDTGNQLREPITGKAVHIAEKSKLAALEQRPEETVKMLIPFHAVGTEAGLLTALRIDRMELIRSDGRKITLERPLVGLYEGKLSSKEEYQMLLHTEIETGGKGYDN